jgi:hypothetical protein
MQLLMRRLVPTVCFIVVIAAVLSHAVGGRKPVRGHIEPSEPSPNSLEASSPVPSPAVDGPTVAMARPAAPQASDGRVRRGTAAPTPSGVNYDTRSFTGMADAWETETDDAEWSLNIKTFLGAMVETLGDRIDAQPADDLSVRCRQSVCRIDAENFDVDTFKKVLQSSREQQVHVAYQAHVAEGGLEFEAYLGRQLSESGDE